MQSSRPRPETDRGYRVAAITDAGAPRPAPGSGQLPPHRAGARRGNFPSSLPLFEAAGATWRLVYVLRRRVIANRSHLVEELGLSLIRAAK
jgi:hypothetical protein